MADGNPRDGGASEHLGEPHHGPVGDTLTGLRAGVLGANDGLISTAGIVVGVAAATGAASAILTAGIAGLVAGAVSMALGEYVSVSTQRDTERALIAKEARELREMPEAEFDELSGLLRARGLSPDTARRVAEELTANDPLRAHLGLELGIDEAELSRPILAAASSALSFAAGAAIPVLASLVPAHRIAAVVIAVLIGLALTGYASARLGGAAPGRAVARVVIGGVLAMAVTYAIGSVLSTTGIA